MLCGQRRRSRTREAAIREFPMGQPRWAAQLARLCRQRRNGRDSRDMALLEAEHSYPRRQDTRSLFLARTGARDVGGTDLSISTHLIKLTGGLGFSPSTHGMWRVKSLILPISDPGGAIFGGNQQAAVIIKKLELAIAPTVSLNGQASSTPSRRLHHPWHLSVSWQRFRGFGSGPTRPATAQPRAREWQQLPRTVPSASA